jgi:von Willebrand factor type A domain
MRRASSSLRGAAVALAALGGVAAAARAENTRAPEPVKILVESPHTGEVVKNQVHQAPIRGTAVALGERPIDFDIMVVIDVSGSTKNASGSDVDHDGQVGFNPQVELSGPGAYPPGTLSTDPDDSILAAEVRAADALVASLKPNGHTRVGVITFSGAMNPQTGRRMRENQEDAWVEVPLTADFGAVRARLPEILRRGPDGGTDFVAGIRLAVTELAALSGAKSAARPGARKLVLFLTDGLPTFPVGLGSVSDPGDVEAALAAASVAHSAGIAINTYALGPSALTNPFTATEVARITLGTFLPVQNPGDIVSFLQGATFANVEDVVLTNLTTKEVSTDVSLSPDGTFSGFVPVREGKNQVRVTALTSDGTSASVDVELDFAVSGMSERELSLELQRIRDRNKELTLLVERDHIKRFREHQRKELEIQAGSEPAPPPTPTKAPATGR